MSYGKPNNGRTVKNLRNVMQEVDDLLGVRPRDIFVEFLLCESTVPPGRFQQLRATTKRFGHAAVRFRFCDAPPPTTTTPPSTTFSEIASGIVGRRSGGDDEGMKDVVMNIVGKRGATMVNFIPAEEYLYGLPTDASEQGGVYNRQFYAVRILGSEKTKVTNAKLLALHKYYEAMALSHACKAKVFNLTASRWENFKQHLPYMEDFMVDPLTHGAVSGNCALWSSEGLVAAGLLGATRQFPKAVFVDLYERYMRVDPGSVKVIEYREVGDELLPFVHRVNGNGWKTYTSLVNPILPIRTLRFWNLSAMANVVVEVEATSSAVPELSARASKNPGVVVRPAYSFFWRHLTTVSVVVCVCLGLLTNIHLIPAAILSPWVLFALIFVRSTMLM